MKITRYDCADYCDGGVMDEEPDGEFVKYSDYAALAEEREKLIAEVRSLRADADLWRTEMRLRNDPTVAIMFAGVDNRCVIYRSGVAISAAGTYSEAIAAAHPKEGV